jgi:hypothetical protein
VWWLSIMMSEIWGINSSFYLLLGLGDDVSMVMWSSSVVECHLHIMFLDLMWSVLDVQLGENVCVYIYIFIYLMHQRQKKLTHSQVPGWTHLKVHQSVVAESWDSEGAPGFQL